MSRSSASGRMRARSCRSASISMLTDTWQVVVDAEAGWFAMLRVAIAVSGAVRLRDRQAFVQGARRVLRHRHDQLRGSHAPRRAQLGRAHAGPDGAQQHSAVHAWLPGLGEYRFCGKCRTTTWCWRWPRFATSSSAASCSRAPAGRWSRCARTSRSRRRSASMSRVISCSPRWSRRRSPGAAGALYAHYVRIVDPDIFLFIYTVTMVIMVVTGGKGTLAGPIVGGIIFGLLPEMLRELAATRVAVDHLRRADDPDRLLPAAGHRAGGSDGGRASMRGTQASAACFDPPTRRT